LWLVNNINRALVWNDGLKPTNTGRYSLLYKISLEMVNNSANISSTGTYVQ